MSNYQHRGATIDELYRSPTRRIYGKMRGQVVDNEDSLQRGRLRVAVENVTDERGIWAEPCLPYAAAGVGFFSIPPIETGVWVEPIDGRLDRLVYCGFFWKDGECPADPYDIKTRVIEMPSARIAFKDDDDEIIIETKAETPARITLKGSDVVIEGSSITFDAGGTKIAIDMSAFNVKDGALKVI